jgi:predicted ABC-type ATPase
MDIQNRKIIIIAGPNGAGKTTFANEFLPDNIDFPNFVNADLIAAGLSPFHPDKAAFRAGRLMLSEIQHHIQMKNNFAFETTLSGRGYARQIPQWQSLGYQVKLFFISLQSPELAVARVRSRVFAGGHNIPTPTIRRRFQSGLDNFHSLYKPIVNEWALYDNSAATPILVREGTNK